MLPSVTFFYDSINPPTIIIIDLPEASFVTIKTYNILGQEIKTLLSTQKYRNI